MKKIIVLEEKTMRKIKILETDDIFSCSQKAIKELEILVNQWLEEHNNVMIYSIKPKITDNRQMIFIDYEEKNNEKE